MKILKKVQELKDYSKALFSKSNKISDSPKGMIDYLLAHSDLISNEHILEQLAQITNKSSHTTEIANILTSKLEKFQYKQPSIKDTFVLLQCIIYILKHGNSKFSFDIEGSKSVFSDLEAINSRCFENKFMKNSKQLNYALEMIKQKATYIKNLIQNPLNLAQQRQKVQQLKKDRFVNKLQNIELSVECETNVNLKKEFAQQPVYLLSSNRSKKQGSNKIVQVQEEVSHEIQEKYAENHTSV